VVPVGRRTQNPMVQRAASSRALACGLAFAGMSRAGQAAAPPLTSRLPTAEGRCSSPLPS
jgi:hypothetical protein